MQCRLYNIRNKIRSFHFTGQRSDASRGSAYMTPSQ